MHCLVLPRVGHVRLKTAITQITRTLLMAKPGMIKAFLQIVNYLYITIDLEKSTYCLKIFKVQLLEGVMRMFNYRPFLDYL